ncbi:hypothetical protein AAHE18_09G006600 [Arachis hypogaea]
MEEKKIRFLKMGLEKRGEIAWNMNVGEGSCREWVNHPLFRIEKEERENNVLCIVSFIHSFPSFIFVSLSREDDERESEKEQSEPSIHDLVGRVCLRFDQILFGQATLKSDTFGGYYTFQ